MRILSETFRRINNMKFFCSWTTFCEYRHPNTPWKVISRIYYKSFGKIEHDISQRYRDQLPHWVFLKHFGTPPTCWLCPYFLEFENTLSKPELLLLFPTNSKRQVPRFIWRTYPYFSFENILCSFRNDPYFAWVIHDEGSFWID